MFAIRICHLACGLELNGTRPLAGAAACLQICIVGGIRLQACQGIWVGRDRPCKLTFRCIRFDILRVIEGLSRKDKVPLCLVTCLGPCQFGTTRRNLRNLHKHRLRAGRCRLNTDIVNKETVLFIRVTYPESNILTRSGIAFEADNDILPCTSLWQIECSYFCERLCFLIGSYTYCYSTCVRIAALLGSRHERYLIILRIPVQLRQEEIVVLSFSAYKLKRACTIIRIFR